jgi:hypothetical protein
MHKLDEVSEIELGFPHDFLRSTAVARFFWGGTFDHIDRKRQIAYVEATRLTP